MISLDRRERGVHAVRVRAQGPALPSRHEPVRLPGQPREQVVARVRQVFRIAASYRFRPWDRQSDFVVQLATVRCQK